MIASILTRLRRRFRKQEVLPAESHTLASKSMDRRTAIRSAAQISLSTSVLVNSACGGKAATEKFETAQIKWEEYFKGNYRQMTQAERDETVERLTRLHELQKTDTVKISSGDALPNTLYGYAFNISKCEGYMECVEACVKENNQDRETGIQYIRLFEMKNGQMSLESGNSEYVHEVPAEGQFYLGTQCFHCEDPPCTKVCPVGATWKEADGIVVIDYDWCIGCRYCEAACPYWGRRFNWQEPKVPEVELNKNQHYLGNRKRGKGVMEKCTFCVQRTRQGLQPACVEACPTGARTFGNLLDPDSEIRYILKNKKVFRLKEELGTQPKFWYYMD
jgi:molybdopterin-containing oxidoreductase family iron-sulfur binding subunit